MTPSGSGVAQPVITAVARIDAVKISAFFHTFIISLLIVLIRLPENIAVSFMKARICGEKKILLLSFFGFSSFRGADDVLYFQLQTINER